MISQMRVTFTPPARAGLWCPPQLPPRLKNKVAIVAASFYRHYGRGVKSGWTTEPHRGGVAGVAGVLRDDNSSWSCGLPNGAFMRRL